MEVSITFWIGDAPIKSGFPEGVNANLVLSAGAGKIIMYKIVGSAFAFPMGGKSAAGTRERS